MSSVRKAQAELDFKSAMKQLRQNIPAETSFRLSQIVFPEFDDSLPVETRAAQLESALGSFLDSMNRRKESQIQKTKEIAIKWFIASHPFARFLLQVAKSGTSEASLLSRPLLICEDYGP